MDDCIYAVTAADENYVMPLAVTLRSWLDCLGPHDRLHWFVIDGGITAASRERLERSWRDPRLTLTWLEPNLQAIQGLPASGHVNRMTYVRLLLPALLPPDLPRILYLDSDLVVLRNLADLWNESLQDAACLACVEVACPRLDARLSLPNYEQCGRYLVADRPIPNYQQHGLDPAAPYFNAGVLSINLKSWRETGLSSRLLACLHENRDVLLFWDQYALNVVLYGQWRALDGRWNQGEHLFRYPSASQSPLEPALHRQLRRDPWIVHFTSQRKPWCFESTHPFRAKFFQSLDRTDWRGWRPDKPYGSLAEWLRYRYDQVRQWRSAG